MFEDNTYKTHKVHNDLYEALQKSVELDYSNQHLADQEEARKKKRKRRESPTTPPGSPPTQPHPPPPPAGASGTDIAKIPRKRSKTGKHEHGNGRAHKEPGGSYQSQNVVNLQSTWSTKVKVLTQEAQRLLTHGCHAGNPCVINLIQRLKNKDSMIRGMEGYDQDERLTEKGTRSFS
ncbi:hypothetical protein Tco_0619937 [Tanacetum coccineum]